MYLAVLLRPGLSSRFARKTARRWRKARARWLGVDKEPWVLGLVLGLVIAAMGLGLWRVYAHQDQRLELARHEEQRNLMCLAWNVYFEARGEPLAGQYAVAEVTMNRKASGRFSDTVCGVVYQQNWDPLRKRYVGAFSWTERQALPLPAGEEWERARKVAESVYFMREPPKLHGVMYFHSVHIKPEWAAGRKPVARIGRHVFYK